MNFFFPYVFPLPCVQFWWNVLSQEGRIHLHSSTIHREFNMGNFHKCKMNLLDLKVPRTISFESEDTGLGELGKQISLHFTSCHMKIQTDILNMFL